MNGKKYVNQNPVNVSFVPNSNASIMIQITVIVFPGLQPSQ